MTGSSRGIGRAIAPALATGGFDLAIHGRSPSALDATIADTLSSEVMAAGVAPSFGFV
jgi:NAD(P)-dependent dehydrogenase (short-subunit alcohol dehydrogenase family)